jgi:quinoprotein glucose dehydrogenase
VAAGGRRVVAAEALDRDRPEEPVRLRARVFVLAAGYAWSSHLLLLSASSRFPHGVANSSGLVGRYVTGHRGVNGFVEVPMRLYPGIYEMDSLLSKRFQRYEPGSEYIRHDLRIWETDFGRAPRLVDDAGGVLFGDRLLADWRSRAERGAARLRAYYDVLPGRDSRLTLDAERRTPWGDPTFRIELADDPVSQRLRQPTEARIVETFERLVRSGGGRLLHTQTSDLQDHPGGGCRMGDRPESSVVDGFGRAHDHPNLWIVGAPTIVSGGCNNGTLTFCALALRSAARLASELPRRTAAASPIRNKAEVAA